MWNQKRRRGGFTLVELLVVMSLLGVVGLGFGYLYVNSQRYMTQSMIDSAVQGEASFALEHIKRQLLQAVEVTVATTGRLTFRVQQVTGGPEVQSQYELVGEELQYTPDTSAAGTVEVIARNIADVSFTRDSRTRITVTVRAEQTAAGGDTRETQLTAVIGLKGIF